MEDKFFLNILRVVTLASLMFSLGCFSPEPLESKYSVAFRQFPAEPIYSRVTYARPPETHPNNLSYKVGEAKFFPAIHYNVRRVKLEEAAKLLADTARYQSYCVAAVAKNQITLEMVGTIDEIAHKISTQQGVNVVVDHANKEVRILQNAG